MEFQNQIISLKQMTTEEPVLRNEETIISANQKFSNEIIDSFKEIYKFLDDSKIEVRKMAVEILAGLSLDDNGIAVFLMSESPELYLKPLATKIFDVPQVAALVWDALTNFVASEKKIAHQIID